MDERESNPNQVIQVTDTLDLHGFFPEQIPEMIETFIENARRLKLTRLCVIHGKGKSRLKFEVYQALRQNPFVIEFHDAPPELGHWGATLIEISDAEKL